jgi:glycosyltransferase involved in cell wall biosynthesis
MKKYEDNPKIKYIPTSKNQGVNVARNIGFEQLSSDTDWVVLLDSDDEFFPDALENMKKVIEEHKEYKYFRFAEVYKEGKQSCFAKHDNFVADYSSTIRGEDVYGGWTAVFHKSIVNNGFSFNPTVNGFESIDWFELSKKEDCLYSLSLVKLYQTDTSSLTRPAKKDWNFYQNCKKGNTLLFEKHGADMQKYHSKFLPSTLYELGKLHIILGEKRKGLFYTLKAVKHDPFNLRLFRNILKIFLPSLKKPTKINV